MCDVERLVFMALPAATANLGQPPANHIAGNHNQETFLVQISVSINININIYNNNDCSSLGLLILKENVAGSCVLNFDATDLARNR